jgi:Na+-transporting methylmalonyl-CoA/oxaloacetate decarboxylase gamma subunit
MMQYAFAHVLFITSVSMGVLFLVLVALAVMVNLLIKFMPERPAPPEAQIEEGPPADEVVNVQELDQIAAAVGVVIARARAGRQYSPIDNPKPKSSFNPWRDWSRSRTAGCLDRGWRLR